MLEGGLHGGIEGGVEAFQHGPPVHVSLGDDIELRFDVCREIVVQDVAEVLQQKVVHHQTNVGGEKLAALLPGIFSFCGRLHLLS